MEEYRAGVFVTSKAGHDKNKLYIIIKADSEYVYLVDGKYKTLETPKKKNIKHVQIINKIEEALAAKISKSETVRNEEIKRAIKLYKAEGEV